MFELSVIYKYLVPRWRQLSVSIIGLISICVIALVIWLVVVFFSVTRGLEKSWIQKLTALTAPIRINPTDAYYRSYYYLVDGISANSDYTHKTIAEKLVAYGLDPYDPESDEEVPANWPKPDLKADGSLKDPVKALFTILDAIPDVQAKDFEITSANLALQLVRSAGRQGHPYLKGQIDQPLYISSADLLPEVIGPTLLKPSPHDIGNLLSALRIIPGQEQPDEIQRLNVDLFRHKLKRLIETLTLSRVATPSEGWTLPHTFLPANGQWSVAVIKQGDAINRIVIPKEASATPALTQELVKKGLDAQTAQLVVKSGQGALIGLSDGEQRLEAIVPLIIEGGTEFHASIIADSWKRAREGRDLHLELETVLQGIPVHAQSPMRDLEVRGFTCKECLTLGDKSEAPYWFHQIQSETGLSYAFPEDTDFGSGILLPKSYREGGASIGDKGHLLYLTPTASALQEQSLPVFVAGFYDPGILSMGGRFALVPAQLVNLIRSSQPQPELPVGNGINVRFQDLGRAEEIKREIAEALETQGLDSYWKVETFREFDFAKDLLQQLGSEKNLYHLIAGIVILVACSNIISLLIILVNDKRKEIGILRSMGATSFSIAAIFGGCGVLMGLIGSALGIALALLTLANLQHIVGFLSFVQGHEMFNPHFYGEALPTELSAEALLFVLLMTSCVSLLAGLVPAVKACRMKPSEILRSE